MSSSPRIHHLNPGPAITPQHNEMGKTHWNADDNQRRQSLSRIEQQMIDWNHDLFGVHAELDRGRFDLIDGCSIHAREARFAQSAVARSDTESFKEGFQACRTAIHRGRLYDFGREKAAHLSGLPRFAAAARVE